MKRLFAVILHANVPPELHVVLKGYLHQAESLHYFFALGVEPLGYFVEVDVVKDSTQEAPWKIQIPQGYVLSIADMSKGEYPIGFLSGPE